MSGSYDRPPGGPGYPPRGPAPFDPYDDVTTGPPTHVHGGQPQAGQHHGAPTQAGHGHAGLPQGHFPPAAGHANAPRLEVPRAEPRTDMYAPARSAQPERERSKAPIVPPGSVTGRSLTLVVSIMCFLACLTAGAVYMMNQSANAWLRDIASEVTVQVEPREKVDIEKAVKDVSAFLIRQPGIRRVIPLSVDQTSHLLEPWLGQSDVLKSLPVPRLIALELDRDQPPDFAALRVALSKQYAGVSLDDHRQWQQQIRTVTRSFALGGLAILALVAAATVAIIISAARSAMASNREIVEVLHFVGAADRFIAREFERHFLALGVKAGLVGAVSAMLVFFSMPAVMQMLGGGSTTMAEMQRLIGTGTLDPAGYAWLGSVVIAVAAICMLTSRFGVYRMLNAQH